MADDDVWRMSLMGSQQGQEYDVSWWVRQHDFALDPGSDHDDLLDHLETIATKWKLAHTSFYTLNELRVQKIWDASSHEIDPGPIFSRADGDNGSRDILGSNLMAPWIAGYTSIHTNRGGRRGKGWYFWSNLLESDVNETAIRTDADFAYDLQKDVRDELVNVFMGDTAVATYWELGVLSRRYAHLNPGASLADVFASATGIVVHSVLTSQKSRRG